jgi:parallel beta-helix repeat protein
LTTLPRMFFLILTGCILVSFLGCAPVRSRVGLYKPGELKEQEYGLYTVEKDTVWEGRIRITGDVFVKEGVTLTIMPGTVVRFDTIEPKLEEQGGRNMLGLDSPYFPGAEIIVRGRIIAVGTRDLPITFTSSDKDAKPGSWGAVNLLGSNGNVIEYCHIYYAYNGIHNHASTAVALNNVFMGNGTALSFKKADFNHPCWMLIEHNRIVDNKSGISARNCIVEIAFNDISKNEFYGIWIREGVDARVAYNDITGNAKGIYLYKAPALKINYNNIYGNSEYNIAMAEENPDNLDATENWWGTTDGAAIEKTIFDKRMDDTLGKVTFEPLMDHIVTGTVK